MRVILGKAGKSRVLEEQMMELNQKRTLMIDSVGLNAISHLAAYTAPINSYVELIATLGQIEKDTELNKEIDVVVLSLNTRIEDTNTLLEWEKRLNKKFIVTVQDNEVDRIMMFDMSLPQL